MVIFISKKGMQPAKNMLLEMAVYSEKDVFEMNPVASVSTEATNNLEGEELRRYVYQAIQSAQSTPNSNISENDIGVLIRHHCGFRNLKKAALLTIPYILKANLVTAPWRRKVDKNGKPVKGRDKRLSGMISAPILIDGVKYLCNITNKTNLDGKVSLYALTLKDGNGNIVESEKMNTPSNVPHSNSEQSTSGNVHLDNAATSHEVNPSLQSAKIQQKSENNQETNENRNMNKKQTIRLNEAQFYRFVKESVKRVLKERIAGEKGMSDVEVMRRRNDNFIKDMNYTPNSLWDNPFEPNYGDRIEMNSWFETPEETELKVASDRYNMHRATQNHKYDDDLEDIVSEEVKRVLRESSDCYTMDDWRKDGTINLEIGQEVDNEVLNQLINGVPPHYLQYGVFQPGEAFDMDRNTWENLYMTFKGNTYIGLKPSLRKQS